LSELNLRRMKDGVMVPWRLTPKSARDEIARRSSAAPTKRWSGSSRHGSAALFRKSGARRQVAAKQVLIQGDADQLSRLLEVKLGAFTER
jgi:hypothetical protein